MSLQNFLLLGLLLVLTFIGSPATANGPVCPPSDTLSRASFPKGFIFGTATSGFQIEGALNKTCRGPSLWDVYCEKHPKKCNGDNGHVAVDFFHRYKEDIQLMKSLNTDAFRMSIAWSRIFPFGRKEKGVSRAGVQFYHDLIDELLRNDIMPSVTIFHWDTPQYLEYEYRGFLDERIVKDFREYAEYVFNEYGGKVKHWVTLNEPWVFAHAGYDLGIKAPGRCSDYIPKSNCTGGKSGHETYIVSHNLLNAHAEAVEAFRQCEKCKGGKIGIAHSPAWFEPKNHASQKDKVARENQLQFMMGWHVLPTITGEYPEIMRKTLQGRLPEFTTEQKKKLINSTDFLGINYYSSVFLEHVEKLDDDSKPWFRKDAGVAWEGKNVDNLGIGSVPNTAAMPVYARGFRQILKYVKDTYGNPEIVVMENGYGEHFDGTDSVKNGTADYNRVYYHQRHILAMYEAICIDKVNVTGYYVWSLMDNFEWDNGYAHRFGLYYIDYKNNLTRHEKESAKYFREFLGQGVRPSMIKRDEL